MALRTVNLVPESVLQPRYMRRHVIGWGIVYALIAVLLFGGYLYYTHTVLAKRRNPSSEAQIRKRLAATIADIETKQEALARLAFVRDVSCPVSTAQILSRLAEHMDPKVWLTEISLQARTGGDTDMVMEGRAGSNARLGATIKALTDSGTFRNVALVNASELTSRKDARGESDAVLHFRARANAIVEKHL